MKHLMRTLPSVIVALAMLALVAGCESDNSSSTRQTAVMKDDSVPSLPAPEISAPAGSVYNIGDVSIYPVPYSRPMPVYPFALRRHGVQGAAVVEFIVTTTGEVADAHVIRATEPEFGRAALDCIRHWRFRPGKVDDRPVNVRMQVPIQFSLNNE